jgi:hypothetical protein
VSKLLVQRWTRVHPPCGKFVSWIAEGTEDTTPEEWNRRADEYFASITCEQHYVDWDAMDVDEYPAAE